MQHNKTHEPHQRRDCTPSNLLTFEPLSMSSCNGIWEARREKLFHLLPPHSLVIVAAGEATRGLLEQFYPHSNFYYLTGLEDPEAIALFSTVHSKPQYILFWKAPDERELIWDGPRMGLKEVKEVSGANKVFPGLKFTTKLSEYLKGAHNLYYTLGVDSKMDQTILQTRDNLLRQKYCPTTAPLAIWELNELVEGMRVRKDKDEIVRLRKAIEITALAYREVLTTAAAGMYEYEIEAILSYVFRREGSQGPGFSSIVASGPNSTVLHYRRNSRRIERNDLLLVDAGAKYGHYCADVTRTWPVSGKFTKPQKAVYQAVLAAHKAAIQEIRPGVEVQKFHHRAILDLTARMVELGLLSGKVERLVDEKAYEKFYMHKTGHFLGIEVHDLGGYFVQDRPRIFEPGMVITVEPGLYIRARAGEAPTPLSGIGVRIEDDVLVTETGCEVLTDAIPKEVEELEELVQKRNR